MAQFAVPTDLGKVSILLGKNGSGKSRYLRYLANNLPNAVYVHPERGGNLRFVERVKHILKLGNQDERFKLRTFKLLRDIEKDYSADFEALIKSINEMLDDVKLESVGRKFLFKLDKTPIPAKNLSSGATQIIALSVQFVKHILDNKDNKSDSWLLLDEPDTHLHPDLQIKFFDFLCAKIRDGKTGFILATHSTAIVEAALGQEKTKICFLRRNENIVFKNLTKHAEILPYFGGHVVSKALSGSKILLVEGEDDVRIFSQVYRSSERAINVFPVSVDGKGNLDKLEKLFDEALSSICDAPECYSLRDGDELSKGNDSMVPIGCVKRFRLRCCAAENLLLTKEVLEYCGKNWRNILESANIWQKSKSNHGKAKEVQEFLNKEDRRHHDVKGIRNIILEWLETKKPWETLVGIVVSKALTNESTANAGGHSIKEYLGKEFVKALSC
mmetsp:Transcript_5970/g.6858  ORF Transcript_5970/g.6858 Transcript_5970/m.6858 type:complete len:444 (+) Transcript_5970:110-1441(+)